MSFVLSVPRDIPASASLFATFRFLFNLSLGIAQSIVILISFAPKWIIATGGYVSAPVIIAAVLLKKLKIARIQIFLHEQNSIPGQLNGLMGRWVDKVLLTFPQTLSFFPNATVVGYPIRHSIVPIPPEQARERLSFKIPQGRQVIFAFGGSQGARTINRAIIDALPFLYPHRHKLFIVHGSGLASTSDYDAAADTEKRVEKALSPEQRALLDEFYYRQDYFHNIAEIYSVSSLDSLQKRGGKPERDIPHRQTRSVDPEGQSSGRSPGYERQGDEKRRGRRDTF